ncbi:hypothetical protein ISS39_06565 [Candidatus Bathyarchaeota archaeon]|nr:hypothetical protein [Candidatus Bathyarchaeota archaeon]
MFERIKRKVKPVEPSGTELNEFTDLTSNLIENMVDFTLLTLRTLRAKKGGSLNKTQIEEIVNFDLQFRIQQIQDPELLDAVRERATSKFLEEQTKNTIE